MISIHKRINELDRIKGIAIVLVVVGHILAFVNGRFQYAFSNIIFQYIYIFHMPLFFWVSGYLFSDKTPIRKNKTYISTIFCV